MSDTTTTTPTQIKQAAKTTAKTSQGTAKQLGKDTDDNYCAEFFQHPDEFQPDSFSIMPAACAHAKESTWDVQQLLEEHDADDFDEVS